MYLAALNVVDEPALDNDTVAIVIAIITRMQSESIKVYERLFATIPVTTES